jgi:hypothetical protein
MATIKKIDFIFAKQPKSCRLRNALFKFKQLILNGVFSGKSIK